MINNYNEYVENLINSVTQNLWGSKAGVVLIKHYNSLDLKQDIAENCFGGKLGMTYIYHEFDGSVMADAYEPFLSCIKKIYYEEYDMPIDDFLDACGVYKLHRSIIKSYYETGICKREEEVLISEVEFECNKMLESIANMLEYISLKKKIIFVFNRINNACESTIRILLDMIDNEKYNNISVIATYNEMNNMSGPVVSLWEKYMDYLVVNDCIVEWNFNDNQMIVDFKNNFIFSVTNMLEYIEKLRNMYQLMAIHQAEYYLSVIYKKIEVEQLNIPKEYTFSFMELYAEIALMLENNSDAMIYAEAMKNINTKEDKEKEFRYKYILSKIYMFSGLNEESKKAAKECYEIAKEQGKEFDMFRASLLGYMATYSGWKDIMFLDRYNEVANNLLEDAEKYGYLNQMAHIYVFSYDNQVDKFKDIENLEETLKHFYKGIKIAKSIGNDQLLIEGYKKNAMIASINGLFNICNYFYTLLTEVDWIKNNEFEMANIYNGLGYNNCAGERYAKANDYYNKALIIFYELNEPEYIGETLYNMAVNAMLANEYKIASEYLEVCLSIVRVLKVDSLRVCNISKIFGLLTLCYYRMGVNYNSKLNLQSSLQYLDHLFSTDNDAKRNPWNYLWDDDLFLCYYNSALALMEEEKYEQALNEFNKAQEYMEASPGFLFFTAPQFCMDKAILYKYLGRKSEAENIIEKCREFCEEKGYLLKANTLTSFLEKFENKPMRWNLLLKGISLSQIEGSIKSLAIQYSYKRQKLNMEFLSVWQKTADNYNDTSEKFIETSVNTFKNYFNMNHVLFIRFEDGIPNIKFDDGSASIDSDKINYLIEFFEQNRTEVITSRIEINYFEYRELIGTVLCNDRINSVVFAPIYKNEKLDSIFVTYSILKDGWNSLNSKVLYDKDELQIFMFFFRELLATLERLEDKKEIENINNKLKEANVRLSQLAISDMLTGLLNRQGLSEKTEQIYGLNSKNNRNNELAIMYVDLDNFKYYNDTFGHDVGDIVLCGFANVIDNICNKNNGFAVRYGGDQFLLIINSVDREEIDRLAQLVYSSIKEKECFAQDVSKAIGKIVEIPKEKELSASIGIFLVPEVDRREPKKTVYNAIKYADKVLYHIKKTTKHRYEFYDDVKELL